MHVALLLLLVFVSVSTAQPAEAAGSPVKADIPITQLTSSGNRVWTQLNSQPNIVSTDGSYRATGVNLLESHLVWSTDFDPSHTCPSVTPANVTCTPRLYSVRLDGTNFIVRDASRCSRR